MPVEPLHRSVRARRPGTVPLALAACCLAAPLLAGCQYLQPNRQTRGVMIDKIDYAQLVPGSTTRTDVVSLLGSPTSRSTFDDNTWIYVGEVTEPVVMGFPAIDRQQTVVMNFDSAGTLKTVQRYTGKDAIRVAMNPRVTPSPGSEASILQQVIGNVGRVSPAGLLGGAPGQNPNGSAGGGGGAGNTLP